MIGCENLGDLYQDGQSVPVNLDKARELFAKSCSGGHNLACIELKALDTK
jgi:TPR repeat protein